ncbi:hypothetical protein MNBD_GAMMA12-170 [hydrothermal vent metagenome]|uniref:EamA domain-containing protein n=1 Tax=hydrothermal vent metagenome TaxID=652676 RepID=A0A3B0YC90_9ZZZZ
MFSLKFAQHQPVLSLLLAAVLWGLLWWPLQYFNAHGINGLWTSIISYSVALLPGLWLIRKQWSIFRLYPIALFFIALSSGLCNVSFIVAVAEKDAARIVLLFYLSPVWAILLGILFLGERPSLLAIVVAILALSGAVMMLYNPYQGTLWPRDIYDLLAIFSGFMFAVTNLLIRGLSSAPVAAKTFASWLGVILVAVIWLLITHWSSSRLISFPDISLGLWLGLLALGLLGVTSMTLAVQYGVSRLPLFKSSIILVFEVVITIVSSLWLTSEQLLHLAPYGALCIVLAAVLAGWTSDSSEIVSSDETVR